MAVDLSSISNQMVTAQALGNLILAWPQEKIGIQPQQELFNGKVGGGEKFLFNYEGEQTITMDSEITDNYVENNSAIQDHISLAPEIISTNGFIGELTNTVPEALEAIKQAADKLTVIDAYTPGLSISAIQTYNRAFQAYQAVQILKQTKIPSFSGLGGQKTGQTVIDTSASAADFAANVDFSSQNQQQIAFQKFYGYRKARTLFTVQTPWAIFKNCAILNFVVTQDETTGLVSSFSINFKPINVAYTRFTEGDKNQQGRAYYQGAVIQESGMTAVNFKQLGTDVLLPGA